MATSSRATAFTSPLTSSGASADIQLPSDATDTISSVRWSPVANHLAGSSWDGNVRVYDVAVDGSARGVAMLNTNGPALSCDWSKDGTLLAAGGADKQIHLLHGATGQANVIGSHDAPVRGVRFINVPSSSSLIVATGSWDKTVRYWDMRQAGRAIATLACAERVYSMDTASHLLVIATADRHIHLVDLQSDPMKFSRTVQSPLKYQTRAVAAFPNGMGWGTAGIEGRSGINAVKADTSVDFTFRCHRDPPDAQNITKVWAVNDIRFHPIYETTFSTAGADGTFHFWDRIKHQRLKSFKSVGGAITATDFSHDGSMFAYAVGYDWSFGYAANTPGYPLKWMLHRVAEGEVNPKKK